ncbi:MAG TPA: T9SS type A sorting domain-containing protein [Flavobacteriales bacterium]
MGSTHHWNKALLRSFLMALITIVVMGHAKAQINYTWTGTGDTAWNDPVNWNPSTGFPSTADNVTIPATANAPVLDSDRTVNNLVVTTGVLDLGGRNLTYTGTGTFSGGSINNGTLVPNAPTASSTFSGTTFQATVNGSAARIFLNGSTFHAPVTLNKTGNNNDYSTGGCIFNNTLSLEVSGTGRLYPNNTGTDQYNGNVLLASSGGGIWMGQTTGSSVLAAGRTIGIGPAGFTSGSLLFRNFTQNGGTPQNLVLTGTATLYFQTGTVFHGPINCTSPGLYLNGSVFQAACGFTKTGTNNEYSSGGNTFNGATEFTVTGPGILFLDNIGTDQFNAPVKVNSTGGGIRFGNSTGNAVFDAAAPLSIGSTGWSSGELALRNVARNGTSPLLLTMTGTGIFRTTSGAVFNGPVRVTAPSVEIDAGTFHRSARFTKTDVTDDWGTGGCIFNDTLELTNQNTAILGLQNTGTDAFNGPVIVNNLSTGSIRFGNSATSSATLASGRTLTVGSGGFAAGALLLRNFVQSGTTPQTVALGPNAQAYFVGGNTLNAAWDITAGGVRVTGSNFKQDVRFVKTGTTNDYGNGGNVFDGTVEFTNTGLGTLFMAESGADQYNGNIVLNNTTTGQIRFGNGGGTSTLASGRTIAVGNIGFDQGLLLLRGFVQLGNTPQNITVGSAVPVYIRAGSVFNADLTLNAGNIYLAGSTFEGRTTVTKTGTGTDGSPGSNIFNSTLELINANTGSIYMSESGSEQYNGDIIVNNLSTGEIRFGNGGGLCQLASGRSVTVGSGGFATGLLLFRNFSQPGGTAQTITIGNTASLYFHPGSTWSGDVTATSGRLFISGTTFQGRANFTKTGTGGDGSAGGNTFQGDAEFTNTNTGAINLADAGADQYNGNIRVNNTSTGAIRFGNGGGSSTLANGRTIAVGSGGFENGSLFLRNFNQLGATPQTLSVGVAATLQFHLGTVFQGDLEATGGRLYLAGSTFQRPSRFTKTGAGNDGSAGDNLFLADVELNNTGTGGIYLSDAGADLFDGNIKLNNTSTGSIRFGNGGGSSTLTDGHTVSVGAMGFPSGLLLFRNFAQVGGTAQNLVLGDQAGLYYHMGNTFDGDITSTSGSLFFNGTVFNGSGTFTKTGPSGDGSSGGNVFQGRAEFTLTSTGTLDLDRTGVDQFNGDVVLNNTSTGQIGFGQSNGTAMLANGRTISVGTSGFTGGTLVMRNFKQLGNTAQNLSLGVNARAIYQTGCVFNGEFTSTSGALFLNGSTFNANGFFTKTGASGDASAGGNTFNGNADFFNTGAGNLSLDYNGSDLFNGNIRLNNTSTGQIYFGQNGGDATLANGRTITVGAGGFNSGSLSFRNFTQLGGTPQVLLLGSNATLTYLTGTTFHGDHRAVSGGLLLNGATFNGPSDFTKTNAAGNVCSGGNVFNGSTEFTITGAGLLYLHNTGMDQFNGDIRVNGSGSGGLHLGNGGGSGTLANGRTISIGAAGFTSGVLGLHNFTQTGTTAQNLVMSSTGSGTLQIRSGTTFNGALTVDVPGLLLDGGTFNGPVDLIKRGSAGNNSRGGNTFNAAARLVAAGTGNLLLANSVADVFNANARLIRTGTGGMDIAYTQAATFLGDVSLVGSTGVIQFGRNGGETIIAGPGDRTFTGENTYAPNVRHLRMNTSGGGKLMLQVNMDVYGNMHFQNGQLHTSAATSTSNGLLRFANSAIIATPASAASFVDGFVRRTGNTAFTFPVGNAGYYAPVAITAPSNAGHHFTARYVHTPPNTLYSIALKDVTIDHLSTCEYWIVDRTNGTSNVGVTLSWEYGHSGTVTDPSDLIVARWNGGQWKNHGNGSWSGNNNSGVVSSNGVVTAFSPFTLGSRYPNNPLPVELLSFQAEPSGEVVEARWSTASETNNDHFTVERSADGLAFTPVGSLPGAGNSQTVRHYTLIDSWPLDGTSYYRLRQVDTDGTTTFSDLVPVHFRRALQLHVYPNPVMDRLNVQLPQGLSEGSVLRIVDATGRTVRVEAVNGDPGTWAFDVQALPLGAYVLEILDGDVPQGQARFIRE